MQFPISADTLRFRTKIQPYWRMLQHVDQVVTSAISKQETSCLVHIAVNERDHSKYLRMIRPNNGWQLSSVGPLEFLDILKIVFPECVIEYKENMRLDASKEAAFFLSWT